MNTFLPIARQGDAELAISLNDLLRLNCRVPFEPYRIHLSDGTRHDVRHPEMLAIGVRTSRLFIYSAELPELIDSEIRIDNLHITKTVPMQAVDSR